MTDVAQGAQFDFNVLFIMAMPVILAVWIYMAYALITWRASRGGPEPVGGPTARGHLGLQVGWILTTIRHRARSSSASAPTSSSSRAGPAAGRERAPSGPPTSKTILPIQVIGQQWKFTYRYPTFGGFETDQLVIPDDTTIQFNVTSLDVIHSFWAYQLGVKADANPDYNNVAYTTHPAARHLHRPLRRAVRHLARRHVQLRPGRDADAIRRLGQADRAQLRRNTTLLPPFALTYTPDANGADGGYYPDNVDPYSHVETYGATATGRWEWPSIR